MTVLALNAGSNSLKCEAVERERVLLTVAVEGIGRDDTTLSLLENKQVVRHEKTTASDYAEATKRALAATKPHRPDAVGHRIVHGGERFTRATVIDDDVVNGIRELEELAPLHNANALQVIRAAQETLGRETPMVAVFDTAFHRSLPARATTYALPFELARKHGIRRYGFHGISHEYLARRYAEITGRPPHEVTLITTHLESGCSICAVSRGRSVDTSMGLTPLEGLMMGKRSGDIDPSIVGHLARKEQVSLERVEEWLNKESGLLGVSGRSHDTRELMKIFDQDERVRLALEVFSYRLRKYVGAYLAALEGAEALVFGGGIGENTPFVRQRVVEGFAWCGMRLDPKLNEEVIDREGRITTADSRVHAWVIPTQEGVQIAREVERCLRGF